MLKRDNQINQTRNFGIIRNATFKKKNFILTADLESVRARLAGFVPEQQKARFKEVSGEVTPVDYDVLISFNSRWETAKNQPGFIEPPTPEGWTLSITPHELTEYLFCGCAFINYLLAFFSDRHIPPAPPLILTRPIRPEELPADFDVVASDEKPPKAIMKLEEGKSNERSNEPDPVG
ncbi:hypothetical protein ACTXT7_003011 [Hymenolepis weldensis]